MKILLTAFILFISITKASSSIAIDLEEAKYKLSKEDLGWLSQVQLNSDEYSEISMAAKTLVLERFFEERKEEFLKTVESAEKIILNQNSEIKDKKYLKEWHESFINAEKRWLEQLALDGNAYEYAEGSLGGNGSERMKLFFMIKQIDKRINNIKSSWWYKQPELVASK